MTLRRKLREAAEAGNINGLYAIINKDPHILERIDQVPFVDTPLHVAVVAGQGDFAMEIIKLKPSLARKLNKDGYSALQLALQKALENDLQNKHLYENIVLRLLAVDKDLVRVKAREGYTPLHFVAEQEDKLIGLLAHFLVDSPECIQDVTIRNETALHLAAKKGHIEALQVLAQSLRRTYFYGSASGKKLLNWKDKDGNTALHIAVVASKNQTQMIRLLLHCKVNMNEMNSSKKTALDVLQQPGGQAASREAIIILRNAGALNASSVPKIHPLHKLLGSKITTFERAFGEVVHDITNMSAEKSSAVLVILVLILTSTYQATLSPPGGLSASQPDASDSSSSAHKNSTTSSTWTSSKRAKSSLTGSSFLLFYVPNTIAFMVTLILTLGLLALVSTGITYLLLVPLLLLYFCLLSSTFDISPTSAVLLFLFLPIVSLPIIIRVIGLAKRTVRKYRVEEV